MNNLLKKYFKCYIYINTTFKINKFISFFNDFKSSIVFFMPFNRILYIRPYIFNKT